MIRSLPLPAKSNAEVLNEVARAQIEARRGGEPAASEREAGKSALGVSDAFGAYYGDGSQFDATAGRFRKADRREGVRLAVSESFAAEAETYNPPPKVVPRSRFGLPSRQMAGEYGASKGQEHVAFIEQLESFRTAPEGSERFDALWKQGTDAERAAYQRFVNKGK
jgi:hypothetical protein